MNELEVKCNWDRVTGLKSPTRVDFCAGWVWPGSRSRTGTEERLLSCQDSPGILVNFSPTQVSSKHPYWARQPPRITSLSCHSATWLSSIHQSMTLSSTSSSNCSAIVLSHITLMDNCTDDSLRQLQPDTSSNHIQKVSPAALLLPRALLSFFVLKFPSRPSKSRKHPKWDMSWNPFVLVSHRFKNPLSRNFFPRSGFGLCV